MTRFLPDGRFAGSALRRGPEIAVMPGDFPVEQDVFELGAPTDVVDDHVAAGAFGFAVDDHADVRNVGRQIPSDKVTRGIVGGISGYAEFLSFAAEKDSQ